MFNKIFVGMILIVSTYPLLSQPVDEIIRKNLTARGGFERINSLKTLKLTGIILAEGITLNMSYYRKMPSKLRLQVDLNGQSGITVFNGSEGWIIDPARNIMLATRLSADECDMLKPMIYNILVFYDDLLVNYNKKGIKADLMESVRVDEREAYKIKVLLPDSTIINYYIDKKTNLDFRHDVIFTKMDGAFVLNLKKFTNVNHFAIPLEIDSRLGNSKLTRVIIENILMNVDIDDELFEMPGE